MFDYETTLSSIEFKVRKLVEANERLKREVLELTEANEEYKELINNQKNTLEEQQKEIQILKLRNTIEGKGDSTEIKIRINQLIRNIDKSLASLTKVD